MSSQFTDLYTGVVTQSASERFLMCVDVSGMSGEFTTGNKCHRATFLLAFVRLHSCREAEKKEYLMKTKYNHEIM